MSCSDFRERIFHYQAGELAEDERTLFESHREACAECAGRLGYENAFLEALRRKLPRTPAPAGLGSRVRASLGGPAVGAESTGWLRTPGVAVAAAAMLMALLLVPGVTGGPGSLLTAPGDHRRVNEVVTVIDRDCAEAGRSIEVQRRCRHPLHVNALLGEDGSIWNVNSMQVAYRRLLLDPEQRGRRVRVTGELFHALETLRIDRLEPLPGNRL